MNYYSNAKSVKEFEILKSFVYNIVLSIFITLVVGILLVFSFKLRMDIVVSPSMTPKIMVDDVVVVRKVDDYKVNDIIEFQYSNLSKPVTHRIVEIRTNSAGQVEYVTKGDAVSSEDFSTITKDNINGKVIYIWKEGGKKYEFFKSNYFLFIDILVGVWVLSSVLRSEKEMSKHNIAKA